MYPVHKLLQHQTMLGRAVSLEVVFDWVTKYLSQMGYLIAILLNYCFIFDLYLQLSRVVVLFNVCSSMIFFMVQHQGQTHVGDRIP